jgi:hypothetical protein
MWEKLLQYANTYPSPHNSQPIKIKIIDEEHAEVFYDKRLGLPAESFGVAFGYVCCGVFLEMLSITSANMGYRIQEILSYEEMDFTNTDPLHLIGKLTLHKESNAHSQFALQDIEQRQTSRLAYEARLAPVDVIDAANKEAEKFGQILHITTDAKLVKEIIYVNQRTLFYDLENNEVRKEIKGYLRFSRKEAAETKDGLSAECLVVSGSLLKFFINNHNLWSFPFIGALLKTVYLNSMKGVPQIAWLTGKFDDNKEYLRAGRCFIRIWLIFTQHDIYLHPFGSVITNTRAHKEFCDLVSEKEEKGMAWMLFRFGYSKKPPVAFRRDIEEMIIK